MLRLLIEEIESAKQNWFIPAISSYRTLETVQKAKALGCGYRPDVGDWFGFGKSAAAVVSSWRFVAASPTAGSASTRICNRKDSLEYLRQLGEVSARRPNWPDVSSTAYRENGNTQALTPPIEVYSSRAFVQMPERSQKIADPLLQQTLADFKFGVDNVIFSVDTSQTGCWFC